VIVNGLTEIPVLNVSVFAFAELVANNKQIATIIFFIFFIFLQKTNKKTQIQLRILTLKIKNSV
jgi:hypothetical protein